MNNAPLIRIGVPTFGITRQANIHGYHLPWLFSANSLFCRRRGEFRDMDGEPFMGAALDSAGFVAMARYGGYPWTLDQYVDLGALEGWDWWAAMDYCCEPEIAGDAAEVRRRVELTAKTLGDMIAAVDSLREEGAHWASWPMPVIQGWTADSYCRSVELTDRELGGDWPQLVGLGSVCRRRLHGPDGLLAVFDALDRELPPGVRVHLFGVKSHALSHLGKHPRLASVDSQAWDFQARIDARRNGVSNTLAHRAKALGTWYGRQLERLEAAAAVQARLI